VERGGEGDCEKEGGGEEGERDREPLVDSSFFLGEFLNLGKSPGLACARMNASASAWRFSVSMARLIGPQIGFQYSFDALFDAFFFSGLFLAQALLYSTECSGLFLRQATSETSPLAFLRATATRSVDALSVRLTCPLSFLRGHTHRRSLRRAGRSPVRRRQACPLSWVHAALLAFKTDMLTEQNPPDLRFVEVCWAGERTLILTHLI